LLLRIVDWAHRCDSLDGGVAKTLLDDMCQFVGDQLLTCVGRRREPAGAEDDVTASSVGGGVQILGGCCRFIVGVNANLTEVEAESRLEEGA
jgi:hypothetical protein